MSYSNSVRMRPETLRSLGFGSMGASYVAIGTPFAHPIRLLQIQNLTDATLLFSFDGVNDHVIIPASVGLVYDITTNKSRDQGWYISQGTTLYVKNSGTPTSGSVYVTAFYGSDLGV
jgi:hypothetical protein